MKISEENFKANRKGFNRLNPEMTLKPRQTFGLFKVTSFIVITRNLEFNFLCGKYIDATRSKMIVGMWTRMEVYRNL